jgi:hypothetical protein
MWKKINKISTKELHMIFDKNGKPESYFTSEIINTQAIPNITRKRKKNKKLNSVS